ncbi:MAG: sugar phosphate isomerase/epimerase [Clostridiaceae bacterium]|nr:sugar phosphate isomerase/epimerase [Clostridiaceae bacterium]
MIIGAQLYSVCTRCDSNEGIRTTFKTMKEIGYNSVQISGFAYDARKTREYADEFDLHIGLTHTEIPEIINETDAVIKNHQILGADVVGIGYPGGYLTDGVVQVEKMIADLSPAAKKLEDAGLKLAYHNHYMEFADMGGYCAMDVLYEKTNWNFTLDTGWVDFAGADAVGAVKKYASRLQYVHIKDFRAPKYENESSVDRIVPIYYGATPMDEIMQALIDVGTVKVAYVEQDNAVQAADPYGEMKKSYDALKIRGWTK